VVEILKDILITRDVDTALKPPRVRKDHKPPRAIEPINHFRDLTFYITRLFDFRRKAGRGEFVLFNSGQFVVLYGLGLFLIMIETMLSFPDYSLLDPFSVLAYELTTRKSIAVAFRKLHDLCHSGWAMLLLLIHL
jgi:uncharacterized membrane protein YhaH (DUF805 family)